MSRLRIFTDENVHGAVVDQLRRAGIEVLRCEDVDMKSIIDKTLLEFASENGYALLSMDDDMTRLHNEFLSIGRQHEGIFFAPMSRFRGEPGIGPIVRYCIGFAERLESEDGTIEANLRNRLVFVKR